MAQQDPRDPTTPVVVSVTSAPASTTLDQDTRIKRYLITMTIRTVCFLLFVLVDNGWRWIFLVGAAILPYVAVVLANARAPRVGGQVSAVVPHVDDIKHLQP